MRTRRRRATHRALILLSGNMKVHICRCVRLTVVIPSQTCTHNAHSYTHTLYGVCVLVCVYGFIIYSISLGSRGWALSLSVVSS